MIVTVQHHGGAPGATTIASLLARHWPGEQPRTLVEADPAGGVLAARWHTAHGLRHEPGLLNLAAARTLTEHVVDEATQPLTEQLGVIVAPAAARPAATAIELLIERHLPTFARLNRLLIVDLGRVRFDDPSLAAWEEVAAARLVVCGNRLDDVTRLANDPDRKLGLMRQLIVREHGDGYPPEIVAAQIGIGLVGSIPDDPTAAHRMHGDGLHVGRRKHGNLHTAAGQIAQTIANTLEAAHPPRTRRIPDARPAPTPTLSAPVTGNPRFGRWPTRAAARR